MVTEFELQWMRVEIILLLQIGLIVLANVMVEQSYRYDQRYQLVAIILQDIKQFLFFVWRERTLEVPHHMHQHVGMFFYSRFAGHGALLSILVGSEKLRGFQRTCLGHDFAKLTVMRLAMGTNLQFMTGMEAHQSIQ